MFNVCELTCSNDFRDKQGVDDVETIAKIGVGMERVVGMVGDGYKYLSPCSSLMSTVRSCSWMLHII